VRANWRWKSLLQRTIGEWYKVLDTLDAAGKTSMLQDVEAGRKTEVEMLAGTAIEMGRRYGIATPVNARLFQELEEKAELVRLAGRLPE
jgi:2-dehydropantoate 2-reductase